MLSNVTKSSFKTTIIYMLLTCCIVAFANTCKTENPEETSIFHLSAHLTNSNRGGVELFTSGYTHYPDTLLVIRYKC